MKQSFKFPVNTPLLVSFIFLILNIACREERASLVWETDLPVIGSQSSPRTADLNGDGVLDLVIGAGKNETQESSQGIIAFDGKSGQVLWQQSASDQVYGSATFYDISGDGVSDIFIGGRGPRFKALDGKDGKVIWEYIFQFEHDPILKHAKFNFNNSILVPDQNGNGFMELLTVNGGNSLALPNSEKDRSPGVLMLFDAKTGSIIAADTMPDGKESYMSPLCFLQPNSKEPTIIFGSGGETISGSLYMGTLANLLNRRLSDCKVIASETGHGFIAPPSAADINGDGYYDIIAISHASSISAVDGKNGKPIWQRKIPGTESSNSVAVGYFTDDAVPDFFTFVSKGEWPNNVGSLQVMLNGIDGEILFQDSVGCTGFSSPVVYYLYGDNIDVSKIIVN